MLGYFTIDLTTVKVFVAVLVALFLIECLALVMALVQHYDREARAVYAGHLVAKSGLLMIAILILYSSCLEVHVQ